MHVFTRTRLARRVGALAAALALVVSVSACGNTDSTGDGDKATDTPSGSTTGSGVVVKDAWVKAVKSGMTGAFGEITNNSDADVTVVSATSDAAKMVELHEVVDDGSGTMVMQPKKGGFPIPAGETYTLEPGADHIMFMDVTKALKPGDTVSLTLKLDNGDTVKFDAPVKPFTGAQENYQPSGSMSPGDMSSE